jgi:hypothetical protein
VQGRIIHAQRPPAGHLRRLLIRTGGRHGEAELLRGARSNLLMRPQLPSPKQRTAPLAGKRVLTVINQQFYLSQFASQAERPSPALPEGKKLHRFPRLAFAGAPVVAGVPTRGLPPRPPVQCQPDGETAWMVRALVSYDDTACMVALCRSRNRYPQILRTVSRCTPTRICSNVPLCFFPRLQYARRLFESENSSS